MASLVLTPTNHFPTGTMSHTLSLLEGCSAMEELKQIHARMFKTGLIAETITTSKLISFCASSPSGDLTYARLVFDGVQEPNTFMWNIMIRGYSKSKNPEAAFLFYQQMLQNSVPHNAYTFPFLLKACTCQSALDETQQIHAHILKTGFGSDIYSANSLIHVYAKSGSLTSARCLFNRIAQPDTVSWNSMIDGYTKCGNMESAWELFNQMPAKNVISWTSMISGCTANGLFKEALDLFHNMQMVGIKPDNATLACTLSACAHHQALDQGRWVCEYIDKNGIQIDSILGCAIVDMYAKCGDIEEAFRAFRNIEKRSIAACTAMITGFAIHRRGKEAVDLFENMQREGIKPNSVSFIGVLTACSHSGMVDEGKLLFESMKRVHNLTPSVEHYGCMVDLLGRAGKLKEAEEVIETMQMNPNASIWGSLLNAGRIHKNFELGERVGKILIEEDPYHGGRYIHLASIFAAAGKWDQAVKVRKLMKDRRISKLPGCTTISLNGLIHEFVAGDRSNPHMKKIYLTWNRIAKRLREEGYRPEIRDLLLDLDEEEKETAIHQHSEKLAIAFGLIRTEPGTTIRIAKNLRVCEDCHTATKLISKVYSREIVMRDRTRFHHFKNGNCSCTDYW